MLHRMGSALRQDFSTVKIVPSSREAERLDAFAFARNEQVHFAPGQYRPETPAGRQLLGHELAHVAQQRRGQVETTAHEGETPINDQPKLEQEAERWGERAAAGGTNAVPPPPAGGGPLRTVSQPAQLNGRRGRPRSRSDSPAARDRSGSPDSRSRSRSRDRDFDRDRDRADGLRAAAERAFGQIKSEVDDHEVRPPREVTSPPRRQNNTLNRLREEYEDATEHLDDRNPAFRATYDVVEARIAIDRLRQLTDRVQALDAQFAEANIGRRDDLRRRLSFLEDKQEISEKNGLLRHLSTIYDANIDFWEEIWGSSARLFRDVDVAADVHSINDYANYQPGTEANPIPIVWYKAPTDYKKVQDHTFTDTKPSDAITYQGPKKLHTLGVAAENKPRINWKLRKTLSSGKRKNQVDFNQALIAAHFSMANKDGDHTKDLGFDGEDKDNNFWPLNSTINRRAFNGYNSRYVLHYQDTTTNRVKARPIGGLIGKWFKVKSFLLPNAGPVPAEAGKKKAGTSQV